jgi:26S proteasome regulatory subunit N9
MDFLESLVRRNPPFFEAPVAELVRYIQTRHWYELGLGLINFLELEGLIGERQDVYQSVIQPFERVLDPFHLAQLIFLVSEEISSPAAARQFLDDSQSKLEQSKNAKSWIQLQKVKPSVSNGEFDKALHDLVEIESTFDHSTDQTVRTLFYKVRSSLDTARGDWDSFYLHAFLYLSASGERKDLVLAYDLCHAALCSSDVFSFVELASHGIIECLRGTENGWLRTFIYLLADGSSNAINEFESKYLLMLRARPSFGCHIDRISVKVRLCVLQELIFQRPYESRVFKFDELATTCQVAKSGVELLILKALAGGLVEGFIDEVEEKFVVTRCKTKALSRERIAHLKTELERWTAVVHERRVKLEGQVRPVIS